MELDLLLWAAGNPDARPDPGGIDPDRVSDLLSRHRLVSSFLHRVAAERPRWAGADLLRRLGELHVRDRGSYASQLRLLRRIAGMAGSAPGPLIAFKGLAAYLLTRDPRTIHPVLDLDLLAADPEPVLRALTLLGFRQSLFRSIHEHAKLERDGEVVDVHRYYPVYPDAAGLAAADVDPAVHPGIWHTPGPGPTHSRMRYDDLLACSARPQAGGAGWVVPDLETSALIACIDMHRDCATRYCALPKSCATLRLADVVDLRALLGSDAFDAGRFLHLVDLHGAERAVRFAAEAARSCLGWCPPALAPALGWSQDAPVLIHYLWANCCPVDARPVETMEDLLIRSATISELVSWLGANVVAAGTVDSPRWHSTRNPGRRGLHRFLCCNDRERRLHVDLAAARYGDVLELDVAASAADVEYEQMVLHLDFGRRVYELHLDAGRGQVVGGGVFLHTAGGIPGASAWRDGDDVRFRVRVLLSEVRDDCHADRELDLLLGVRDREVGTLEPVSGLPMMMVPLQVIL